MGKPGDHSPGSHRKKSPGWHSSSSQIRSIVSVVTGLPCRSRVSTLSGSLPS